MTSHGEQLCDDLRHLHAFVAAQQKNLPSDGFGKMLASQASQFAQRLLGARGALSGGEGVALSDVISEGPWSESQKQVLASALNTAMESMADTKKCRRPNQRLEGISKYLTESELKLLAGDAHPGTKLTAVADRCVFIGLHLPTEQTCQGVVATMIEAGVPAPTAPAKFDLLREFKKLLKTKTKHQPPCGTHLVQYPASPHDLPSELFSAAYEEEGPNQRSDTLGVSTHGIPLRKTSKLVRGDSATSKSGIPQGFDGSPQQVMAFMMRSMMEVCRSAGMDASTGSGGFQELPGLVFANRKKQIALSNREQTLSLDNDPSSASATKEQEMCLETWPCSARPVDELNDLNSRAPCSYML